MFIKSDPRCMECEKTESLLWRTVESGQICQDCYEEKMGAELAKDKAEMAKASIAKDKQQLHSNDDSKVTESTKDTISMELAMTQTRSKSAPTIEKRLRKSTRTTRFKSKIQVAGSTANGVINGSGSGNLSGNNKSQSKGARNRRNLFKRPTRKAPVMQATTHFVSSVFHKGSYLQVGDIVSMLDSSHYTYYAQIRGLLVDVYCEKSAYLTWLIPTQESPNPNQSFDPATYLVGPDEEFSRKLTFLDFVMHAPSNYYIDRTTPFPIPDALDDGRQSGGFIWINLTGQKNKKSKKC